MIEVAGRARGAPALRAGFVALAFALVAAPDAHAQTSWTDGTGNWFNAANWDNGVPTSGQTVNIANGGTAQIDAAASAATLSITGGSTVEMQNNASLSGTAINLGTIGSAGTLSFTNSLSLFVDNVIAGSGGVTITGFGGQIFRNNNTYTGGTTIVQGAIVVGDGNTTGSIVGDVVAGTATSNSGINFRRSDNTVFSGNISGLGYVAQAGDGVLTLAGNNTYQNYTQIGLGTVAVAADSNLGAASALIKVGSLGTLRFLSSFSTARSIEVALGSNPGFFGTIDTNGNTNTLSGVVSGNILKKVGAGTLVLTNTNTYAGGTIIGAGTLQIGGGGATGAITGNVTDNGTLAFNRSDSILFGGVISGTGSVVQAGAGTTTLSGTNTYTGGTTVSAGTLRVGTGGTQGSIVGDVVVNGMLVFVRSDDMTFPGVISGTGILTKSGSNTLTLTGANTFNGITGVSVGTLQIGNGGTSGSLLGRVALGIGSTLVFNRSDTLLFPGRISADGAVKQIGTGTTILTGANTYNNGTTISAGTLQFGDGVTDGLLPGDVLNNSVLAFGTATTQTINGTISGSGSVLHNGPGTTILANDNFYAGTTTISVGTLQVGNGGTTGTISNSVVNNSALVFNRSNSMIFSGAISGTGSVAVSSGIIQFTTAKNYTGATIIAGGGQLTISNSGNIAASNGVVDNGALQVDSAGGTSVKSLTGSGAVIGDITITNATGTFSGSFNSIPSNITISGGTQTFSGGSAFSGTLTVSNGATLALTGAGSFPGKALFADGTFDISGTASGTTIGRLTGSGTIVLGDRILTLTTAGGSLTFAGSITGSGGLTFSPGCCATQILTGTNTYTGLTTIGSQVVVQIGSGGGTGTLGGGDINSNGTLQVSRSGTLVLSGVISSVGQLIQAGSGTATLTAANTYSGGTTISAGTLQLGNGGTTGSIVGNVSDNGTLGFNRSDAVIFSGVISGTGGVAQLGAGTTTLLGSNTYTGGTTISNGTLQLGDGGIAGSILGNVTDNATLAFNHSDAVTFSGAISGTGTVTKLAASTLTLTGVNTYAGGTTISAGTLQIGNGGTAGSVVGDIVDNAALTFNRSDAVTFSGAISGTGGLTKLGAGTLALTSANTYSGGTTISAGTLQLGTGGATGSITGNVTDNATLAFNRSDAVTFSGTISGTGGVTQLGTGTLTLTGANTYAGGTTISAGTLQLGNGGTAGSITGNVANNATLAFNRSDAVTFSGVISGTGALTKLGGGTLTLAGASTYAGATSVDAGTLALNGFIVSAVNVNSGGTLGGTGTTGGVTVASGGVLSPGNSIGTLNVGGSISFASGATYGVEVDPAAADKTLVAGAASLAGQLIASFAVGTYAPMQYTLLTSAGTLSGTFDSFSTLGNPVGFVSTLSYDAHNVFLNLIPADFIWAAAPATSDWNTATNWKYGIVPGASDTAQFEASTQTTVDIRQATSAAALQFNVASPSYTFNITGGASGAASLTLGGAGIVDAPANAPALNVGGVSGNAGTLTFASAATAADARINATAFGTVLFTGTSNPGAVARLTAASGGTIDFSGTMGAASDKNVSAGSIAGAGAFRLGGDRLTVGASNLSTEVSGVIADGGASGGTGASLVKTGTGTLILSGNNSYSGGTTIAGGALQLGNATASGSVLGNILDNGTLIINRTDTFTISAVISGTGGLTHNGVGTTILTGNDTYSGPTIINAGTLVVNGSLTNSAITNNGGTLKGSGTLGSITLAPGAHIAPGNSIGTLNIAGNITFSPGSVYDVEVDATGATDRINATGAAALTGGSVSVFPAAGTYAGLTTYRILTAAAGVNGTFTAATVSSPAFLARLVYGPTTVDLQLFSDIDFAPLAQSANQASAAAAVKAGGLGSALYNAILAQSPQTAFIPGALAQLSGDIYPSMRAAALQDGHLFRQAMLDRLDGRADRQATADGVTVWTRAFLSWGDAQSDGNAAAQHDGLTGIVGGIDTDTGAGITLGLAGGYTHSHLNGATGATALSDDGHVAGYAGWHGSALAVRFGAAYGWGDTQIARTVQFTGFSNVLSAEQTHNTTQIFGEAGYALGSGQASAEPFLGLAWVKATTSAFAESGGAAALSGGGAGTAVTISSLGVHLAAAAFGGGTLAVTPRLTFAWEHAFGTLLPRDTVTFTATSQSFATQGLPFDRDAVSAQLGLDVRLTPHGKLGLGYDGIFSSETQTHAARADLTWSL